MQFWLSWSNIFWWSVFNIDSITVSQACEALVFVVSLLLPNILVYSGCREVSSISMLTASISEIIWVSPSSLNIFRWSDTDTDSQNMSKAGNWKQSCFHHHRRVFCDKMIVMLVRLACQQDRNLRCVKFQVSNRVFLCAMIVTLLLERCDRRRMRKQLAFLHHHRIFFVGMIVTWVLWACEQRPNLRQFCFYDHHRMFLDGMIMTLVLIPCQKHRIEQQVALHQHPCIFSDGMIVILVLLGCQQ